jgi:hypothetical protein
LQRTPLNAIVGGGAMKNMTLAGRQYGVGLILYVVVLTLGSLILNVPAWAYARGHHGASALLLWLGTPALVVWIALLFSNIGQPSLANLIEGAWLMMASVVLAYAQVFIIDRRLKKPAGTSAVLATILCIAAIILRITMPTLPE